MNENIFYLVDFGFSYFEIYSMTIDKYHWNVKKLIEHKKAQSKKAEPPERNREDPKSVGMINKSFFGFN